MARTVWCGATPGLLPLESALRKLPGIIAHLGFIPKSCQYVLLSRDGEKCAGEGFEPDRGVARRDPHEPIARGALRGNQSRAFAPPQGAPPPPTAAHDAAMSPPTTRGRSSPSRSLSRGGSMHQTPRKFGRAQTTDPAEFSWCRARDLNPHGKPIRPSSVRVCQFRQPGTGYRDHYRAPVRRAARRMKESSYSITA